MNKELSDRDLLIKLNTEVEFIKQMLDKLNERMSKREEIVSKLVVEVSALDERVEENTSWRKFVYGSIITSIASLIGTVIGFIANK